MRALRDAAVIAACVVVLGAFTYIIFGWSLTIAVVVGVAAWVGMEAMR